MADVHKTASSFFQSKKSPLKKLLPVKLQITKQRARIYVDLMLLQTASPQDKKKI